MSQRDGIISDSEFNGFEVDLDAVEGILCDGEGCRHSECDCWNSFRKACEENIDKQFIANAEKIAEEQGLEVMCIVEGEKYQKAFEDDGCIHVMGHTTRICVDVSNSQDVSKRIQDNTARKFLEAIGEEFTDRCKA